jgi:hypothetical protein
VSFPPLRRPLRVALVAVAAVLLSSPAWAGPARSLAQAGTLAWDSRTPVRVFDASRWPRAVRTAAGAWNRTGVTPPLRFVSERAGADVVIESGDRLLRERCVGVPGCEGHSSRIGWRGGREPVLVTLADGIGVGGDDAEQHEGAVQLASHELGHVLGLGHDASGCELMHPRGVRRSCDGRLQTRDAHGRFVCGPFGTDLARAERLYQRRAAPRYSPWCAAEGAPAGL